MTSSSGYEPDIGESQSLAPTDDDILEHNRALPERERLRLDERVVHEVVEQKSATSVQGTTDARLWADVSDEDFERFSGGAAKSAGTADAVARMKSLLGLQDLRSSWRKQLAAVAEETHQ